MGGAADGVPRGNHGGVADCEALTRAGSIDDRLLDRVSDAVIETDLAGTILTWNRAAEAIYGLAADDVLGRPISDVLLVELADPAIDLRQIRGALAEQGQWRGEVLRRRADGSILEMLSSVSLLRGADGCPARTLSVIRDVTARRDAERLADSEVEFSRAVLDSLATETAVLDGRGAVVVVNAKWRDGQGRTGPGRSCRVGDDYLASCATAALAGDPFAARAQAGIRAVLEGEAEHFQLDYPASEVDGEEQWYSLRATPLRSAAGAVVGHVDITWRKTVEDELRRSGTHDALTGLPNRTLLVDRLEQAVARARRTQRPTSVAALFCDVDNFKIVNESLGHEAGDRVIVDVARRLEQAVRPSDTLARFGGDQFAVVVEDLGRVADVVELAERIARVLDAPLDLGDAAVPVGVSIGIAICNKGSTAETLLRDADAALHRAKERGRGRYQIFDEELGSRVTKRLETEIALRRALELEELRVFYQPVVNLATGRVSAVEALVRWEHPERGMVAPCEFVPVAEESGLIVPIGTEVLREAARQAARWQAARPDRDPIVVSVNLSGRQLARRDLPAVVEQVLAEAGADPSTIAFEITESVLMEDAETAVATLSALKALGITLLVDDFGTGYSSLSYLKRLPVDALKIDRSFVDGLGADESDHAIVQAVLGLAGALGLGVVAEGVETDLQLAELRALGCDRAQGYRFARPAPAASIEHLLDVVPIDGRAAQGAAVDGGNGSGGRSANGASRRGPRTSPSARRP